MTNPPVMEGRGARGDTLLVPDKGHEKGIGFGGPAHELARPGAAPLLPRASPARSPAYLLFPPHCLGLPPPPPEPLHSSGPAPPRRPRPTLRLHPASLIIASFSQRQIVWPQDAPEDFRPLTNGLLIFYQKGRGKGGRINHTSIFIIAARGLFLLAGCPWG